MSSSKLLPANTPNDGLPEHWQPIEESPFQPDSAPPAAPVGTGPMFAGSIPAAMQLTPDIMPTRYPGGIGGYRIMPPPPSGVAANNAATKSLIETVSETFINNPGGTIIALQTNGIPNASQNILDLVQGGGISLLSGGGGSVTFVVSRPTSGVQFVTTDGSDGADGLSWGNAKKTLAAAVTALGVAGGTIFMGIGTFASAATVVLSAPIIIQGNNRQTILTIPNAANVDVLQIAANHCRVTGCTIDGNAANQTSAGTGITIAAQMAFIEINECVIQNTWAEAIFANGGASNVDILDNFFTGNNQQQAASFVIRFLEGSGQLDNTINISRNTFVSTNTGAIAFYLTQAFDTGMADIIVADNSIQFGGASYLSYGVGFFGLIASGLDGIFQIIRVSRNLISGGNVPGDIGFYVEGTSYDTSVSENSVQGCLGSASIWFNTTGAQTSQSSRSILVTGNTVDDSGAIRLSGVGFAAASIAGNTLQGETTGDDSPFIVIEGVNSGTYTDVAISGNAVLPVDFGAQSCLLLQNVSDISVTGNVFKGKGASQTESSIVLNAASGCSISGNNFQNYTGSTDGAIAINIISGSGNLIGPNLYNSVTTQYADGGTGTIFGLSLVPAPSTAGSAGFVGDVAKDATHWYVCIATNTWVRTTLATF